MTEQPVTVHHGDCLDVLRSMPDCSVDSVVTDPPYGLGFMGKEWDDLPPGLPWAQQCLRVLKPGGHLLSFGGTRTWHRLAVAVEDAGFEIRDSIAWLYGSGFPKSLDVSKAIDKAAGAERAVIGPAPGSANRSAVSFQAHDRPTGYNATPEGERLLTAPATDDARRWHGWGTALKPAFEPIVVARKPLAGTVAQNVLTHGTGALNIDGCRVEYVGVPGHAHFDGRATHGDASSYAPVSKLTPPHPAGRWPANVTLDEHAAAELDRQSGTLTSGKMPAGTRRGTRQGDALGVMPPMTLHDTHADTGGASRFFYVAKAPTRERPKGDDGTAHPTVKPLTLMRWLVRLVTPPGGTVLEPFAGSGTTVEACMLEGFRCIAIERDVDYLPLIAERVARAGRATLPMFGLDVAGGVG